MINLESFHTTPDGETLLCEVDGRLHSMKSTHANIKAFTNAIDRHPQIHLTRDMLHALSTGDEARALFVPIHESIFKKTIRVWYEQGFTEAVRLLASDEDPKSVVVEQASRWFLKIMDHLGQISSIFQPISIKEHKRMINQYAQTRNWSASPIRCISWHPHCTKLAVTGLDDSIRIYSVDSTLVPILKSKLQKNVSCVAWRPLSASEIAVGCETCILIWTVDPNSVISRPSTANSYVLRRVNHHPIISMVWSPHGDLLVSASSNDPALLVWDVSLDKTCALKRAGAVGNTFLSWSQNGISLLAASSNLVFRVWECKSWNAERWNTATGYVQTACWSPCGTILLFATSEEPVLYSLFCQTGMETIFQKDDASPQLATPLLDLSRMEIDAKAVIGGIVQSMDWDPKGRHLAMIFKDTSYVCVFMTGLNPIRITPSCLISGLPEEVPCTIQFQKNFPEGSCLSIAWSSGRLQHFPIVYSDLRLPVTPSPDLNTTETFSSPYHNYSLFQHEFT